MVFVAIDNNSAVFEGASGIAIPAQVTSIIDNNDDNDVADVSIMSQVSHCRIGYQSRFGSRRF